MSSASMGAGSRRIVIVAGAVAVADVLVTGTTLGSLSGPVAILPLVVAVGCWLAVVHQARLTRAAYRRRFVDDRVATAPRDPATGVQPSPLMHRAARLAREGRSARYMARTCDMPIALAELIIAEVRRAGPTPPRVHRN